MEHKKIEIVENAEVKVNLEYLNNTTIQIKENDDVSLTLIGDNNSILVNDNYDVNINMTKNNGAYLKNNHNVNFQIKKCKRCEEFKLNDQFYKNRKAKDGLQSYCIDCNRKYLRAYMNDTVYSDKNSEKYQLQKMRGSLARGNSLSYLKEYLGCSNELFFNWLQFQRSLSSEPIVNEEQDHVLPIKHFKDKPHICWFWINIKPVSQSVNREKSGTLDLNLFHEQIIISKFFLERYQFTSSEEKAKVWEWWYRIVGEFSSYVNFSTWTQVPNY